MKARVFEFEKPITKDAEHSNQVKKVVSENFGHIGRELVTLLEGADFEEIEAMFLEEKEEILSAIQNPIPITERIADFYALWMLTAEILQQDMDINIQPDEIREMLLEHHATLERTFDIGQLIYNAVCSHVINRRYLYPDAGSTINIEGGIEGVFLKNYELVMLATTFDKIVREHNFPSTKFCLKELDKMGVLIRQRKDTYYSKRTIGKITTKTIVINIKKGNEIL